MSMLKASAVAGLVSLLIGGSRFFYETFMVASLVPDAQTPIWVMMSLITSLFAACLSFPLCLAAVRILSSQTAETWPKRIRNSLILAALTAVIAWTARDLTRMATMRSALLDSANPQTGSERLRELASYQGGPGYEIDNRIASHPNTPADVLRMLHGRPDEVGTEIRLAENPNTPDDLLRALAAEPREEPWKKYIQESLKQNPRFRQVFESEERPAETAAEKPRRPSRPRHSPTVDITANRLPQLAGFFAS